MNARALVTAVALVASVVLAAPASAATPQPTCQPTINAARTLAAAGDYTSSMRPLLGEEDSALVAAILSHPSRANATALARQACLSWRVAFGDCLSLDLVAVPCDDAAWLVTGQEDNTAAGEARCATGGTIPLRGQHAVFCLYPAWEATR